VKSNAWSRGLSVSADGTGVVSHVGSVALRLLTDRVGLTDAVSRVLARRSFSPVHDRGRVLVDVAVLLADGGEAVADIDVLRDQSEIFGAVASAPTVWRSLDELTAARRRRIETARARVRRHVWSTLDMLPASRVADRDLGDTVVLDVDATLLTAHSDKESAAPTFKGGFGFHPIAVWCDNTSECLAIELRPGNAGANTAADHITVLTAAIAQIPAKHRRSILVRADGAGCSYGLLDWLAEQNEIRGRHVEFSVGFAVTEQVRAAIRLLPAQAWTPATDSDGELRDGGDVAELTGLLDLTRYPAGTRVIVRRERPHPGAQLSLFEERDGWRYQPFATTTRTGQLAFLEARHRAHARVEDQIRHAKDTGLRRLPSREFTIN
jgi:Transposase DDE domain group 1